MERCREERSVFYADKWLGHVKQNSKPIMKMVLKQQYLTKISRPKRSSENKN